MSKQMIRNFVTAMESDGCTRMCVRLPSNMLADGQSQIRTKKHTALATCFDELGNLIVLLSNGGTRQYVTDQEIKASGYLR